jgi:hypothetical protein
MKVEGIKDYIWPVPDDKISPEEDYWKEEYYYDEYFNEDYWEEDYYMQELYDKLKKK